jgi:hypothetical protein
VRLGVRLGSFAGVMKGVLRVTVRYVRMVSSGMVIARFVMPGGFAMVARSVLVVLGGFMVMLVLRHGRLLSGLSAGQTAGHYAASMNRT